MNEICICIHLGPLFEFGGVIAYFKLNQQSIVNTLKKQRLDIKYTSYKLVDDEIIPQQINIKAKQNNKLTIIDFILRSIELNTKINTSFTIPNGYKRMNP